MKHFWKAYKKYAVISFVALLLIIGVPLAMNLIGNKLSNSPAFEMKDYLAYYGSILGAVIGAVATMWALVKTINFTVKNQKDERKSSIRPYLGLSKYNITNLEELENSENTIFIEISKGLIVSQPIIPEKIATIKEMAKELADSRAPDETDKVVLDWSASTFFEHNYILRIDMYNNGAGNAIDVEYKMNDRPLVFSYSITTDKPKRLVFILNDDMLENNESTLSFTLEYSDVASLARYQQKESINFFRNTMGDLGISQFSADLLTKPVEINKEL